MLEELRAFNAVFVPLVALMLTAVGTLWAITWIRSGFSDSRAGAWVVTLLGIAVLLMVLL